MQPISPKRINLESNKFKRSEHGSLTIFALFLFVLILMMAGMAVDMVRHEHERVALQNAIDTGVVAASSLSQEDADEAATIALVEEYVQLAGYDPSIVTITPTIDRVGGTTIARSVSATVDFQMDTIFMNLMGIDTLKGNVGTTAIEGSQVLEIVLVLDISGSMGGTKLEQLKTAAKDFVSFVLDNNGPDRVSISIVPYNGQVYMDDELHARLSSGLFDVSLENQIVQVPVDVVGDPPVPVEPGIIASYQTLNPASRCARFRDADYDTRSLGDNNTVEASARHSNRNTGTNQPNENQFWCGGDNANTGTPNTIDATSGLLIPGTQVEYQRIMLYENREDRLHDHIDSFAAQGWTAIDYGMNWGIGLLDPSFEPIITDMVDDGLLPESARAHPVAYDDRSVKKFIILMTDGINTRHRDLADPYKAGPTRIWHSEAQQNGGDFLDGFLVEMPDNSDANRWYVPNDSTFISQTEFEDLTDLSDSSNPEFPKQWTYHDVYNRFSVRGAAEFFFENSGDTAAFNEHRWNAEVDSGSDGVADTRVRSICAAAQVDGDIEVFTVAFEAPTAAAQLLDDCAEVDGNFFNVAGANISSAFQAIAVQISSLRLTQ